MGAGRGREVEVLSYGFSKLRKTEFPVFSASQVDKYATCIMVGASQLYVLRAKIHQYLPLSAELAVQVVKQ